jgi:hypothetical protein
MFIELSNGQLVNSNHIIRVGVVQTFGVMATFNLYMIEKTTLSLNSDSELKANLERDRIVKLLLMR